MNKIEALLLLCITLGAFIMPYISRRLGLPSAVGEILFGLIMGLFFRHTVYKTPIIKFLGELGFIMLMYMAGLEVNFQKIRTTPYRHLFIYIGMFVMVVGLSLIFTLHFQFPLIYVLIFSTTAIGLLFPILREANLLEEDSGQSMLIIGSIGEVVSLISLTFYILYTKFGLTINSLIHLTQIAFFIFIFFILRKFFRLLIWWFPHFFESFIGSRDHVESGMRANFVNMFIFVALASLLELELILGAFLGGMLIAILFKERERLQSQMASFGYGFLIPIFFIDVGLRFDLKDFIGLEILLNACFISIIIILIRMVSSLILLFTSMSRRLIFLIPLATSFPLTLLIALATFGFENQMINKAQASAILLAAILTSILYPALFKKILRGNI
jgi:Kef-type K+ transport system membrane component KefB